jgi:hypothetical protein
MPEDPRRPDQFDGGGDAHRDGGATTDRGRRDTGQPGPDPDAAEREREAGRTPRPDEKKKSD